MVEARDWSLRSHAQQTTRPSPTTQADMRPESQRRKRSSFIKAKLMLRLSFFFFRKPSCARMRPPESVSSLKPHETRPQKNETMERFFGPRHDPAYGRKCAKGASLHRNCISMPEMTAMGPVFRGAGLCYEIDVASYQAKRIPCWGLSRSLCKSFHRNLSILALMPSSHSSWLRTRAQPGWWHPSPHLEYSSFTRR